MQEGFASPSLGDDSLVTVVGDAPPASATILGLTISPHSATVAAGGTVKFTPLGWLEGGGDPVTAPVVWTVTGGTISSSGLYQAGSTPGTYYVKARLATGWATDSVVVTISGTTSGISRITVTPSSAIVARGTTQQFTATALLSTGQSQSNPPVTWRATGGTISRTGLFTAGNSTGSYRVIATSGNGKADTSGVTIPASVNITAITVSPAAVSLSSGQTQQFAASARLTDGSTEPNPVVTWTATGGTISTTGLYTAGATAGGFRVIGTSPTGRADTAAVTLSGGATSPPPSTANGMYFNSNESGCGSDPNVVLCDDFEDGSWYSKNCDQANASGGLLQTDGWCGTIYANSYISSGTQCGARGAGGTNCAAYSGSLPGPNPDNTGNMGDHNLGPNNSSYNELYFRWYIKYSTDHSLNPQKTLTVNSTGAGSGGISIGGFGNGAGWAAMCPVADCNGNKNNVQNTGCLYGMNYYLCQNQGNNLAFNSVLGHWVYMELHIRMNTSGQANGVYELWMNDCGTSGICSGSPILRARFTNVRWTNGSDLIRSFWVENQSPPDAETRGSEWYDQIKVSRVGPIGFSR